ncbi:hypothetical protein J3F84DRAFT_374538 [Trichoderma pleuroticola]
MPLRLAYSPVSICLVYSACAVILGCQRAGSCRVWWRTCISILFSRGRQARVSFVLLSGHIRKTIRHASCKKALRDYNNV